MSGVRLADTPVLRTERLVLRAPEGGDWEAARAFLLSERSRHVGGPFTSPRAWRTFGHIIGHWAMRGFGMFVVEEADTGRPMGSIGPWYPDGWPEPEIGWTIWTDAAEGRGYAAEAARRVRAHAYDDLGWTTAVSYIDADNLRSIALAERLGCRLDAEAETPWSNEPETDGEDEVPVLVYRHPSPAELRA